MGNGSRGPNQRGVGLMTFGAQFAEVEVDTWTGNVRVVRLTAVHDVGRVLNPLLARSQLEGGIIQGLGLALFEERVIDEQLGRPLNAGLHDYKIPTMADMPVIDATCLDVVDTVANPVGARGLAEPPVIPTAPAIANAVRDALGVAINALPLSPWRILDVLEQDGRRETLDHLHSDQVRFDRSCSLSQVSHLTSPILFTARPAAHPPSCAVPD